MGPKNIEKVKKETEAIAVLAGSMGNAPEREFIPLNLNGFLNFMLKKYSISCHFRGSQRCNREHYAINSNNTPNIFSTDLGKSYEWPLRLPEKTPEESHLWFLHWEKKWPYLTVMENSPGALSLRLTMNVPSEWVVCISICSARHRVIFPTYHLKTENVYHVCVSLLFYFQIRT